MPRDWYKPGDWNVICDVCGFKRKSSQLVERWDGFMVCSPKIKHGCFEIRHPADLQRPPRGERPIPWSRPEGADVSSGPTNQYTASASAGASSVVITNSAISATSRLIISGTVPAADQTGQISRYTVGSGTATIYFSPSLTNALTIYYIVI